MTVVSSANLNDDVGAVVGHAVVMNRKHRRGLPSGAPVLRVRVEDVVMPYRTALGLPARELRIQSQSALCSPRSLSLMRSSEGTLVLNAMNIILTYVFLWPRREKAV